MAGLGLEARKKIKLIEHYKNCLSYMISNDDFTRWFSPTVQSKILKFSQLDDYKTIYDLLPDKPRDFRIVLTESARNSGHWCCILKYPDKKGNNIFEWFDPYGIKPPRELNYVSKIVNKVLNQDKKDFTHLIPTVKKPDKFFFNKFKFQRLVNGVNTCGRHTIARILASQFGYDLDDYIALVKEKSKETGMPIDILICNWIAME
jgi:hypothetical protein